MERKMDKIAESGIRVHGTLDANTPINLRPRESRVDHLNVDFDQLLEVRDRLQRQTKIGGKQAKADVSELWDHKQISPVYQRVVNRIEKETNFLHKFEEAKVLFKILLGVETEHIDKTEVKWGAEDLPDNWAGSYDPRADKISIRDDLPGKDQVLYSLALNGEFPFAIQSYAHELAHKDQFYINRLGRWYFRHLKFGSNYDDKFELQEVQSWREGHLPPHKASKGAVVQEIAGGNYPGVNTDRLIYFVDARDKLEAMGMPDEDIAKILVEPGTWDKEKQQFPRVEQSVEYAREQLHFTENDLESLVMADKLEWEIESLKVKQITQDEIRKALIVQAA